MGNRHMEMPPELKALTDIEGMAVWWVCDEYGPRQRPYGSCLIEVPGEGVHGRGAQCRWVVAIDPAVVPKTVTRTKGKQ